LHPLQVLSQPFEQAMQLTLLARSQSSHDGVDLGLMSFEYALNPLPTLNGQADEFCAQIRRVSIPRHQPTALEPIQDPGHARRTDKQSFAQISLPQARRAFCFGAMQAAQDTPL
jgi:hypothetical protein